MHDLKRLAIIVLVLATASVAQKTDLRTMDSVTLVQHAAATTAHLHDDALDPASFVLDGVFVTKPDRKGNISVCYEYRAHNKMGGYSAGRAVDWGADKGRLSIYPVDSSDRVSGYNAGFIAPCKLKNIDREITKNVAALAPSLYKKER